MLPFGSFAWNLHAAIALLQVHILQNVLLAATLASLPLSTLKLTLTLASLAKCT